MCVSAGVHIAFVSARKYPQNVNSIVENCGYASLKDTLIEQTCTYNTAP